MPISLAYMRITILDKHQEIQEKKAALLGLAQDLDIGEVCIVEEKLYVKTPWSKTKIAAILEELKEGDNLLVTKLSELSQSVLATLEILDLAAKKKINIYSVQGNWQFDENSDWETLSTAFSLVLELRDVVSQRTKEVLKAKKLAGKSLGRRAEIRCKLDKYRAKIEQLLAAGIPKASIIKRYKVSRSTFYRWLKMRKIEKLQWGKPAAKAQDTREKGGRPGTEIAALNKHREKIERLLADGVLIASIVEEYQVSRSTFYRWLQAQKIKWQKWRKPQRNRGPESKQGRPSTAISKLDSYRKEIEQLLAQGVLYLSICERYKISRSTFYRWLQIREIERGKEKINVGGRPNTATNELDMHREEIERLLAKEVSNASIAEKYKVSRSTFYRWLQEK